MSRIVRIAAGQGFWGDWLEAPRRQVEGGPIDYLMLDYLAEVTMSILQKQMQRDPLAGYARDFITQMEGVLPAVLDDRGVRVVANAGGVNPLGCANALLEMARGTAGHEKLRVGVVTGDDLLPRIDELIDAGHAMANMDTGAPLASVRDRVLSANAYVGAPPIIEALDRGANVVVTGSSPGTSSSAARSPRAATAPTTGARSPTSRTLASRSSRSRRMRRSS